MINYTCTRISFLILIFIGSLTTNCNENNQKLPIAKKGIFDLRKNIIGVHDGIPLNGEWIFSWQNFDQLSQENIAGDSEQIVNLPSSWKTYKNKSGINYSREGFGTYRLKILLPPNALNEQLSIRVPEIASAYKMFINNKLVAEQGQIAEDFKNTNPWIKPRIVNSLPEEEMDLVFYISNNDYNDGGFWNPIEFGLTENILREQFLSTSKEVFLFGAILIMGLYHIGFYFFRRSEKSILYFSIFCFLIAIRTIVTGNRILLDFFPGMPWNIFYRLEYLTFYSAPAPFFLFVSSLYKPLINKWINNFFVISFMAFVPLTFFSISFFTQSVRFFQAITLCGVAYVLVIIILATRRDYQGAKMFLIGWIFLAGTVIFDIMIDVFNVRTVYIASYGFIAFIFFQSLILSSRFSKAFKASEEFSLELSNYKTNLEKIIEERIKDISFLNRMTKEINSSSNIDSILKNVYQYAKSEFGIESVWMLSVEKSENILRTSRWVGLEFLTPEQIKVFRELTIPLSEESGSLFRTFQRKKIFYLPRLNREFAHGLDRVIIELLNLKSLLQIPLVLQGEVVAILCATSYSDALRLTKQELAVLASIAEQIAGAVHNSLLLQKSITAQKEADIAKREAEKLAEISKELSSDTNLEKVFDKVAEYLKSEFNLNYHWLLLVDKSTNELYTSIFNDLGLTKKSIQDKYKNIRIPLVQDSGSLYATYTRKKPFFLTKIPSKGLNGYDRIIIDDLELKSLLQVPIVINGEVEGILSMTNFGERVILSHSELQRVFRFASQIAGAIYSTDLLRIAESERTKSNELLMNILPKDVAEELKKTGQVNPVQFDSATILFTDFKGFTKIAETMTPNELINQLDGAFLQFDGISERFNLEKLKTIGDAYMCAGGLPVPNTTHPYDVCLAALEIKSFMDQVKFMRAKLGLSTWELRIGIHTGSVIAGVIGKKKFAYDIWGDTVNIASRMESAGAVGKINISEATYKLVEKLFVCESRGSVSIKNKGEMGMYYLEGIKPEYSVKGQGKIPNKDFYLATI
jgi:class 3 adenylate cyclase